MIVASGLAGSALVWSLIGAGLLVLINGVFVAYEFALVASKQSVFEAGMENNRSVDRLANEAVSDLTMQMAGSQLGVTIVSLALGYAGEPAVGSLLESLLGTTLSEGARTTVALLGALAVTTFFHLVVGEMIPKNIALAAPEATMRWIVRPYRIYLLLFRPVARLLNAMGRAGVRLFGVEPLDEISSSYSTAELAAIVIHSSQEGLIETDSAELLHGALEFAERPISEIARPLEEVAALRFGATPAQAELLVKQTGQTRLPIVAPSLGQRRFLGYLHAKELLRIEPEVRNHPLPSSIVRQMAVVDADRPLIEVLRLLRRLRRQLAVVQGPSGPIGIVSVEEVIRALVVDAGTGETAASR